MGIKRFHSDHQHIQKKDINIFQECVLEAQDLDDGGFSSEYQARLTEDYEGEKERTNHEENINKRHDYLKIRLDKANAVRTKYSTF